MIAWVLSRRHHPLAKIRKPFAFSGRRRISRRLPPSVAPENKAVGDGSAAHAVSDEAFGRPAQYMKATIASEDPYYIVEQKPRFATTMSGVCTDDNLNLIKKYHSPNQPIESNLITS